MDSSLGFFFTRDVELTVAERMLDHFTWAVIAPTQYVGQAFPVMITAMDQTGTKFTDYTDAVTLTDGSVSYSNSFVQYNNCYSPNVLSFGFTNAPPPAGDGELVVYALADLGSSSEYLNLEAEGIDLGDLFVTDGSEMQPSATTQTLSQAQLETLASDGTVSFEVTPSSAVNKLGLTQELHLTLTYPAGSPTSITPTNTGSFVSGVWTGSVTVLDMVANMVLHANDGSGHVGNSNPFNVYSADDTDGDGLPDDWETTHWPGDLSYGPGDPAANPDYTVWQCYIAGLNPTNPASAFLAAISAGQIVQWSPSESGRVYSVWWTTNLLSDFQSLETNIPWTQGSYTNPNPSPCDYYKIKVELAD